MTTCSLFRFCLCLALFTALAAPILAQDNVTIPKSRLEELERKEAELRRLKGETNAPPTAVQPPAQPAGQPPAPAPARATSPPPAVAAELPPLKPGEVVEAPELAAHFIGNPAAAQQRYVKKQVAVQGEIIRFYKRLLSRDYGVALKTDNAAVMVIAYIDAPEGYDATFVAKNGSEMVGQSGNSRKVLARVGERVVVQGRCKGLKDAAVTLSGASIRPAP